MDKEKEICTEISKYLLQMAEDVKNGKYYAKNYELPILAHDQINKIFARHYGNEVLL